MSALAERVLDALPQTQCTRCGYPDCAGYAQAVADGEAAINQCPPGGTQGVARLSALTGRPAQPLDPRFGVEGPRTLAVIDEAWCIGCTLCLDACPTDAIVGIHKRMHTVIEAHCTGCELCIPACPVDCIGVETVTPGRAGWDAWTPAQADAARARYAVHRARRDGDGATGADAGDAASTGTATGTGTGAGTADPDLPAPDAPALDPAAERKRAIVEAALARARARGRGQGGTH